MKSLIFLFLFVAASFGVKAQQQDRIAYLQVSITHKGKPVACNVRVSDTNGNYLRPDTTSVWKDFNGHVFEEFPADGYFNMNIPYGEYEYEADRGPAFELLKGHFVVNKKVVRLEWRLSEIVDAAKKNWWAGETHIHRKPEQVELLMKASDLYVGEVITSWNEHYPPENINKQYTPKQFDDNRFVETTASEDERGGGALLFFNLPAPFNFTGQQSEYPPLAQSVERVSKTNNHAWIDIEKPFWPDVPVLLATEKINSMGIANNHMLKSGIFDTEAWGKKRDPEKYPSPLGNAYWAQDIYYHILNAGIRMSPSAGSASGVLWNPVGYNRLYAYVKNKLTYDSWWKAVKQGNCFVSNGPLLFCAANKQLPGHIFKIVSGKTLKIEIEAELFSRDALSAIEIIQNGKVYATIDPSYIKNNRLAASIQFNRSGWFLVRAISTANNNFRFASTAPFYVEGSTGERMISAASCRFFLDWLNEREAGIKLKDEQQWKEVFAYIQRARSFWTDLLQQANAL
ncbi:MAG: CehA/McbA family metallohydrolase [Agriterribacter sp.]